MTKAAMWDTETGRRLYDQGMNWTDIAARLGIHKLALKSYAKRHTWPSREAEPAALRQSRAPAAPRRKDRPRKLGKGATTLPALASLEEEA